MTLKSKWIDAVYGLATGSRKVRSLFTPLGVFFFGLLIFGLVMLSRTVDRTLGLTGLISGRPALLWASLFFLVALFLIGWSVLTFIIAKGTPVPANPPPRLVATGPYALVRNPMLTGVFALLFGLGARLGSASLLFLFTPLFILANVWELKAVEEPELEKRLGQEYRDYRDNTPMFFPRFGKLFRRKQSPSV